MVVYSSDNCPRCAVLKTKLDAAGIQYKSITDEKVIEEKGIDFLPVVEIDDGENTKMLSFMEAINMISKMKG